MGLDRRRLGLFVKAPGVWIVMLLIYLAISVVLSLIPFVG